MGGIDSRVRLALIAMGLGIFAIANDFTALSVALPEIEADLDSELTTVQWVINAYALVFGILTVSGGRFADLYGRRLVFIIGALIFAGFSLVAALTPSASLLIAARAATGVGGALMWPAALAMTYALLPEDRRSLAGGLVLGVAGLGNATGPLIGGTLTDLIDWRAVLLVNVPIAALAIAVVLRNVAEDKDESADRHFDWTGMALLSGSLLALLVALDQVDAWGWGDTRILVLLAAAAALMVAFVASQRRGGLSALIPSDVAANRGFRLVAISVLLMSMTFFTALVYLPQFMEKELGFSALGAGVGLLPLMLVFGVTAFLAGPLYERLGGRAVIVVGAVALPAGMALLSLVGQSSTYPILIPGMIVLGLGTGFFYSAATTAAISSLDDSRTGLAGGVLYMLQVAGGSVGLGIATTIVTGSAFVAGLEDALRVSAVVAAAGLAVVLYGVRPSR